MGCVMCEQVAMGPAYPRLVHEFESSVLLVGEHQFHRGYCVLVLKEHVRDLHELPEPGQELLFRELMRSTAAIARAYEPAKINHASYGNQVPHIHWHIIPRYADDPDRLQTPWLHQDRFAEKATTPEMSDEAVARIRSSLAPGRL